MSNILAIRLLACSHNSALHRLISKNNIGVEEKICYKMVYYTLHLGKANRQELRWQVRI